MPYSIRTKPRKIPQQERSRITVEAILTATTHILIKEGYDTASTNKIAERAVNHSCRRVSRRREVVNPEGCKYWFAISVFSKQRSNCGCTD